MANIKLTGKENIATFPKIISGTFRNGKWELVIHIPKEQIRWLKLKKGSLCTVTLEKKQ